MGRVNRTRAPTSLNARHRSTRFHRATRFRAFRSVLKSIERLPAGFMKKLKWSTPRVGHSSEASQNNGQIHPEGYVASHVDTPGYFLVGNGAPQNLQDKHQASKRPLSSARKTRIRRRNARKHSLPHPNYMGVSPAILLGMMIKIEKVKWKSPSVSGSAITSNAVMLQAAMSEDSPTMISVKNIEGIQYALSFLSNLPENVLPTFVQRNSALKGFIQRMEAYNTSTASGHIEKPKNDLGIIEQTVNQLQRRGLVKPYLDKLAAYSSGPEAFSMDAETLMQKVLVDATNSAALTPRPRDGEVSQEVVMMDVGANERVVPKLHLDISQKRAVISLEGSRCNPINLENFDLPQVLFEELLNPFLDKSSNSMAVSRRHLSKGPPKSILGKRARIVMATDPALQLSPAEEYLQPKLHGTSHPRAPKAAPVVVCNHAPCMFNTCENYAEKSLTSPFREVPMIGGPGGQYITNPFNFGDHVEGMQFYQAAMDAKNMRESVFAGQRIAQKNAEVQKYRRKIYQYCQALQQQSRFAQGHPNNWHDLSYPAISPEEISSLELELTETDKNLAHRVFMDVLAKDTPERRKRLEEYGTRTISAELQPVWHEFEEKGYSKPHLVHHEPTKVFEESILEDNCSKMGQSGRGSMRRQVSFEEEPRPQYPNPELEIEGPLLDGSPIFRPGSPQMSTSSESDIFVDCEEEISLVRSSPPKEAAGTRPEIDSDEVMLHNQLGVGPVYTSQRPTFYSTYSSSPPEGAERNPYSTKTNQVNERPSTIFAQEAAFSNLTTTDMLSGRVFDTRLPSEASAQAAMATDSILVSRSPFAPQSLASEPMAADGTSCPKCDKPYKYKGFLKRHMQSCQRPGIPEEPSLSGHSCPTCGKSYKKQGNLYLHMDSCNSKKNNSPAAGFSREEIKEEKARKSLVPFPRDSVRNLSGKPLCKACKSEFTSKRELAKHIKAECATLRVQGSYGGRNKKQPGTPLALSFKEPLSASDFESSDVDNVTEIPSSKFTTPLGKNGKNPLREKRQSTKGDASGMDCGVRKGSIAEQLELIYGPKSKYHTPTDLIYDASSNIMENSTLDVYSGRNGARNGENSDMDVSPTPEPKPHNVGKVSKLASTMSSRRRSARMGMSPGSELIVGGETPASVSRVLVLEPGLSELQDIKPQPTSRKLFSHASTDGVYSPSLPKVQDQQALKEFDLDFPPLPIPSPPRKASATCRTRPSKESGSYRNKLESFGSEVITIRCQTQVVCDDIVKFLGEIKEEDVRHQIVSVSRENGLTVKVTVRPGFDITEIKFDELPGVFVESGDKTFIFAQKGSETLGERAGKDAREKQEFELGTPDEKSVDRTRGWNLRRENRKKNRDHHRGR
ncbi:hypothetical protein V502_09551 [Pseudogymnoascus sp. VKM F-4520 (FW-2644)]|nr:hypothetical protein V502_09551 [Pseudogymnoascus sp. VKM F-4520 (FW-2644)]